MSMSFNDFLSRKKTLAIIGLGYVGLPLAVAFAKHFSVLGFDLQAQRIAELQAKHDHTCEVEPADLNNSLLTFSCNPEDLAQASLYIIAVPTPIDAQHQPDLRALKSASQMVGKHLKAGDVVVYESTVYPGLTEEICGPILASSSGLHPQDFALGYSPERINPGDKVHTLTNITKIVSASDPITLDLLSKIYGQVVTAGIYPVSSIKVAEAAKVIENTQRDLNIALINELARLFAKLGLDTQEVLDAAGSKWNFLPFRPGLVGGHCIGVDPYYLTHKAEAVGFHPQIILAGRRVNDSMGSYIAQEAVKLLCQQDILVKSARIGILGLTFKENVPDVRNTKVVDIIHELEAYGAKVLLHDPLVNPAAALHEYNLELVPAAKLHNLDALILAVPHAAFAELLHLENLPTLFRQPKHGLILDIKSQLNAEAVRQKGLTLWRL